MSASIRGHMGQFKLFQSGQLVDILAILSVDVNQDSSFSRANYVGQAIPEGDQSIEGWSGTLEMETKNAVVDNFIDALVTNNLNGIGVSDYTFITTENYADGTSQSYVYTDCQFKMSRRNSGQTEKITKRLEFQAAYRQKI